jgi:hypothetical protein
MKTVELKSDILDDSAEKRISCLERSSKKTYRIYVSIPDINGDIIDYLQGTYDNRMDAYQAYSYIDASNCYDNCSKEHNI